MPGRLIAIGDIHGCLTAFEALLEQVQPATEDKVVTLGDYIDRGPNSRGVVDLLMGLRTRCQLVAIKGNHEEMMLQVLAGEAPAPWWLRHGGVETLDSYGFTGDMTAVPYDHVQFLRGCNDLHVVKDYFFTHANYDADASLQKQPVEAIRWRSLLERMPSPHQSGRTAIVGHTAQKSGRVLDVGHLRCLDTGCFAGGWLTAMEVQTGQTWQANEQGETRE
ncbi:MAG: metallophosphoesterase family protein [Planctomycetota bacterium]